MRQSDGNINISRNKQEDENVKIDSNNTSGYLLSGRSGMGQLKEPKKQDETTE